MNQVNRLLLLALTVAMGGCIGDTSKPEAAIPQAIPAEDPRQWLEAVDDPNALAQVRAWNTRTLDRLTADPRFDRFEADALAILNADDRIPFGTYRGGHVYNFWQDADRVRGVLRRTSLEQYVQDSPEWDSLLDIDALAAQENANWVYKGSTCLAPSYTRCLIRLSDGGKDASEQREWDHERKAFVDEGFFLPTAKSRTAWQDADTLLVATDWGAGSLTASGYPFIVKRWQRGTDLVSAVEVFRGEPSDVGAGAYTLEAENGELMPFAYRSLSYFETAHYWLGAEGGPVRLPIPPRAELRAYFKGDLILQLEQDWTPLTGGATFAKGALVAFPLRRWLSEQQAYAPTLVLQPQPRSTVASVSRSASKLLIATLDNIVGRAYVYDRTASGWIAAPLELPDNGSITIVSANKTSDTAFINRSGFTDPATLYLADLVSAQTLPIKQTPERFDAAGLVTEQFTATSSDGEAIPYFVVRHRDSRLDGNNPTLLYAYGGFGVSMRPNYGGVRGKLWLSEGGIFVLANIRGGGEFGPTWHQAGLKTKRQIVFDDFIAVAQDLTARNITRPSRLGIMGGSNGGLLTGVMYTQRPDLWRAVISQVPLLDMLRFHRLLAGASWVGEYGDPDVPEERAFLRSISPYHNLREGVDYPEIFLLTSTKDDRVHPGHARKMAALLEDSGLPFAYYENIDGGHSAAANLAERAKRNALEYTFLHQKLMDPNS